MPSISLPLTFHNSFWSQDQFRTGLERLFERLDEGCLETEETLEFIKSTLTTYLHLSQSLSATPSTTSPTSSTISSSLHSLTTTLYSQAEIYRSISIDLTTRIAEPFSRWEGAHRRRVGEAKDGFVGKDGLVVEYERLVREVAKLKHAYLAKARMADDAEEEARFAPSTTATATTITSPTNDNLTPLPHKRLSNLRPTSNTSIKRSGTVADRISEKLRQASVGSLPTSPESPTSSSSPISGLATSSFSRGLSPRTSGLGLGLPSGVPAHPIEKGPILLSGLAIPFENIISMLSRFSHYIAISSPPSSAKDDSNATPISRTKTTILGTYDNCFSGDEFVAFLVENIEGLGGDWGRAETAAEDLTRWGMVSRIGVGKVWETSPDVFYVLKEAATDSSPFAIEALRNHILMEMAKSPHHATSPSPSITAPTMTALMRNYLPSSISSSLSNASSVPSESAHGKARREAKRADDEYREALDKLEIMRLRVEEQVEAALRVWERWERERLGVVKTVFRQYEEIVREIPKRLQAAIQPMSVAVEACQPDKDMTALIQNHRTGPFRPIPHVYEPLDSDEVDVAFGIDLRKWAGEQGWKSMIKSGQDKAVKHKGSIPEVLHAMLGALDEMYAAVDDGQKRKSWIYEVPLTDTHRLRELVNDPRVPSSEMVLEIKRFNAPIVAATVKLWLLELNPPLLSYDLYDACLSLYPAVGADEENDKSAEVSMLLSKLPGAQLFVLDAVVGHLKRLIEGTKTDEEERLYVTKLALSVGRTILRPAHETEKTIESRVPSLFFSDLIRHYRTIFPPLLEKKRNEVDRPMPVRKRTMPIDRRISRSQLEAADDPKELLEQQLAMQRPPPSPQTAPAAPKTVPIMERVKLRDGPVPEVAPIELSPPVDAPTSMSDHQRTASLPETRSLKAMSATSDSDDQPQLESTPTRSARQPAVSREQQDRPLSETESTLSRSGSGENPRLRGPRGARPRPPTGRVTSNSLANISEANGNSVKDRIAKMQAQNQA